MSMQDDNVIQCSQLIPDELPFDYHGDPLDFILGAGEVISIIGPDYSGKGNWLRTICGERPNTCSAQRLARAAGQRILKGNAPNHSRCVA